MPYQVVVDRSACMNCGICMDVCPPHSLDMTRPQQPGLEAGGTDPKVWMMEFPVQVGRCTGCQVCALECPTEAISVLKVAAEPALAEPQGPIARAPAQGTGWVPLSALTLDAHKTVRTDPWGHLHKWRPARREAAWQVWRTWGKRNTHQIEEVK